MQKVMKKQNETNQSIGPTPEDILTELSTLKQKAALLTSYPNQSEIFTAIVQICLQATELALKAAETTILYQGDAENRLHAAIKGSITHRSCNSSHKVSIFKNVATHHY